MKATEQVMTSWDGVKLFYRAWLPSPSTDQALLLFHRGHEHSGRWQETVEALNLPEVAVFAWDARGHGRSPGARGSAENLAVVVKDVETFARHIATTHGIPMQNMVVLAHSVGAVTATAWVHDYAPPIRGLILAVPAFRVKLYLPFAVSLLRLRQKLFGPGYVKSYVKAHMLTHDAGQAALYRADPAIFRQIAVNILLDLHDTSTRLLAGAGAVTMPTLVLAAGADWVVRLSAQRAFFDRVSSPVKKMETFAGMYHAIFHETNRREVVARTREFVVQCFEQPAPRVSLLRSDQEGPSKIEYDRLRGPGKLHFALMRLAMKTVGRLSRGIQLGWTAGFDSGATLDYVYANQPQGFTALGKAIDRAYLNSIGWRGIRERKRHLEAVLADAIARVQSAGQPARVLDIAAGPGRYVLETVRALKSQVTSVLLRDYKLENVEAAQRLAAEFRLSNVTCAQGDAFDRAAVGAIQPRPTIAIVSGLYELFPENAPVLNSLRGMADALESGSYLIYTNQPWHPQLEFIARALTNREGRPWVMRRRTQAEMDELVAAAGFVKLRQEIDPWGIFTVSLARRTAS